MGLKHSPVCLHLLPLLYDLKDKFNLTLAHFLWPEHLNLTALIFFHCRSSSAFSFVSLNRRVFLPSDILMPYWKAALQGTDAIRTPSQRRSGP